MSDYLEQDDCVVWADLCVPDRDDLDEVAEELGLAPLAVEDAVRAPRAAQDRALPTHMFLHVTGSSFDADGTLQLAKVSAFLLPRALVTVPGRSFDSSRSSGPGTADPELLQFGVIALLYGLLDVVVDGHLDAIQQLDDRVEERGGRRSSTSSRSPWTCSAPRTSCAGP